MKLGKSRIHLLIMLFAVSSLLVHVPSDAFAADTWTGSTQDVSELAKILGIPDEQLPPWVANLALWVSEDKISMGDMIVSIEHLINN